MKLNIPPPVAGLFTGAVLALSLSSIGANAATVAQAGTGSTGTGGFSLTGGSGVITDIVPHPVWRVVGTTPTSNWVWDTANSTGTPMTFTYQFDLTGFDVSTASLSGEWNVDNIGTATLNTTVMSTLAFVGGSFTSLNTLGASSTAFVAGINTVTLDVEDLGLPGGFRASFTVTADATSPVPLPASAPLILSGLIGLRVLRKRKKS